MLHETLKIDGTFRSKILQNKLKKIVAMVNVAKCWKITNVANAKCGNKKKTYHCVVYHVERVVGLL